MRRIALHTTFEPIRLTTDLRGKVETAIHERLKDSLQAHESYFRLLRECASLYEAVPRPRRRIPIENAPSIELSLAGEKTDAIYARARDLVLSVNPVLTVRSADPLHVEHARAIQRLVDWGVESGELGFLRALDNGFLGCVKLGTAVWYVPWIETVRRTKVHEIVAKGPRIYAVPPGDFLVPPGSYDDLHEMEWVALRNWYTAVELIERARIRGWNLEGVIPSREIPQVRERLEQLGRVGNRRSRVRGELYEIFDVYIDLDTDGSGPRDYLATFDRGSGRLLNLAWNPFDKRPFEVARYQIREHLFYGIGLVEMVRENQRLASDFLSWGATNALLSNTRGFVGPPGSFPTGSLRLYPGMKLESLEAEKIRPFAMADIYPSMFQAVELLLRFADRRTGVQDFTQPRASQVPGSRTPGITMLALLQAQTTRFAPTFDSLRRGMAAAVKQCLYRFQERLLQKDAWVEQQIRKVLGEEDASLALEVLRSPEFDDSIPLEMTATSASTSREAEQQQALLLDQRMEAYTQQLIGMGSMLVSPQVPPKAKEVLLKVFEIRRESMERTLRAFQVRDPDVFLLGEEDLENLAEATPLAPTLGLAPGAPGPGARGGNGSDRGGVFLGGNPPPEGET